MPNNQNRTALSQSFFISKPKIIFVLAMMMVFIAAAFPKLYEIKTKAGIDVWPGKHAGTLFEKYTGGLFRCEWLYPYYCDRTIQ